MVPASQIGQGLFPIQCILAVEMIITIDPIQEIPGSGDPFRGQPGTHDPALRNPALDEPDAKRPVDMALKAPAAGIEAQSEGVPYFLPVEAQYPCGCCGCTERNTDPGRIEAVVCRFRQVKLRRYFCPYGNGSDKVLAA